VLNRRAAKGSMRGALPTAIACPQALARTRSSRAPRRCQPAPDQCGCQTHRIATRPCCSAQGVLPQATQGASPPVSYAPTTHSHASLSALTRTGAATSGCSGCARLKQNEFWHRPPDSLRLLGKQLAGCARAVQRNTVQTQRNTVSNALPTLTVQTRYRQIEKSCSSWYDAARMHTAGACEEQGKAQMLWLALSALAPSPPGGPGAPLGQ